MIILCLVVLLTNSCSTKQQISTSSQLNTPAPTITTEPTIMAKPTKSPQNTQLQEITEEPGKTQSPSPVPTGEAMIYDFTLPEGIPEYKNDILYLAPQSEDYNIYYYDPRDENITGQLSIISFNDSGDPILKAIRLEYVNDTLAEEDFNTESSELINQDEKVLEGNLIYLLNCYADNDKATYISETALSLSEGRTDFIFYYSIKDDLYNERIGSLITVAPTN